MITVGGLPVNSSLACVPPISAVISSRTILMTVWPAFRVVKISSPTARSVTRLTKSLTTR